MASRPARERKWEIESAAESLIRAEEIRADKQLHKDAMGLVKKKQKALNRVAARGSSGSPKRSRKV